jgi:hypothetical protein
LVVPLAAPDAPVELDQVTCATPTLSLAVPLTWIEPADVETLGFEGDRIVSKGGVVPGGSGVGFGAGGGAGDGGAGAGGGSLTGGLVRLTVTIWVAWFCWESRAVMAMTLSPMFSGAEEMLHSDDP